MKPSCQSYTTRIIRILHASFRYTIGKLHANRLTTRVNRSPPLSPALPRPNSHFPLLTVTTCHRRLPSRISVEDAIDTRAVLLIINNPSVGALIVNTDIDCCTQSNDLVLFITSVVRYLHYSCNRGDGQRTSDVACVNTESI